MHSCELVVTPPVQGAALLVELGTLIIEGRNSKPGFTFRTGQNVQSNNVSDDRKESEIFANCEVGRGALPKRPATSSSNAAHLSPAKRNRDQEGQPESGEDSKGGLEDLKTRLPKGSHKRLQFYNEEADPGKIASTSKVVENLSVYEIKARLANGGPLRGRADALWRDHTPLCIEVLLAPDCGTCRGPLLLLERWTMSVYSRRTQDSSCHITSQWLLNAVRSQLHFSQISAWSAKLKEEELVKVQEHQAKVARDLSPSERQRKLSRETCNFKKYESNCDHVDDEPSKDTICDKLRKLNVLYNLKIPDETYKSATFQCQSLKHTFPITDIGNNVYLEVRLESLPRIEDIPLVNCVCSLRSSDVPCRRKSREEPTFTEDLLAKKLAVACSLANKMSKHLNSSMESEDLKNRSKGSAFCTDSGVINSDMGCTSGISRKFPLYSSPNVTEFGYHSLSSRGSTPERSDLNDSGFFSTKPETKSETADLSATSDDPYQYAGVSNNQVPLNKLISTDYLLVDDRMQTACRQKGKHRCNCDDESDQGASKDQKSQSNGVLFNTSKEDYLGTGQKVSSDEKKIKEMTRHLRRQRKEARLRQMKSNQESSSVHSKSEKKVRTFSSSENSDGRSSPELVHYNSICHGCFCKHQEQQKHRFECTDSSPKDNLLCTNNGEKHVESSSSSSSSTTSIPILQASKFDHVNRFGCFKSTLRAPREFYCLKQQQHMSDYAKFYNKCNNNESPLDFHRCYCTVSKIADDDYRPSTKKLISSATQTDDMLCECGKSLIPRCSECTNKTPDDVYWKSCEDSSRVTIKRSDANHNLAAVSKSNLLLEAIVRAHKDRVDDSDKLKMGHDKKVIDYNCDNSVNILNNCECDKNIVYSDSLNEPSCTKDSLSPLIDSDNDDIYKDATNIIQKGDAASPTSTDLSVLLENNNIDFESNSHMKYLGHKEKPPDNDDDKQDFVIKKPKLKRSSQTIDKINRIMLDRSRQKTENIFLNSENRNTLGRKPSSGDTNDNNKTSLSNDDDKDDDHVILYEKGDYGKFGKIVESSSDRALMGKLSDIKKEMFNYNVSGLSFSTNLLDHSAVPSTSEMDKFRYRLDSAASMVFHSRTGLPLTSSPAPLRRGKSCFDYDSSINSVSGIKSALYGLSNGDLETPDPNPAWSPGSSPGSPSHAHTEASVFNYNVTPKTLNQPLPVLNRSNKFRHGTSSGLLGSFEESVLNGRLEPAATVAGFTAEIGASGEFCPSHLTVPVTVFFYSLGDNTTSSPYLGHINLGRKGYCVPRAGTIQVTLFNPHGTVVKMFVVMYNLEDMPPHSRTFLRQRTLWGGTCLRYLIHLRFLSSKSGKVYLHTDIRIIVSRKADLDTAAAHSLSSALVANSNNNCDKAEFVSKGRKSKVETGTFRKRTKDEKCNIEARKLNRSNGCYELSAHCPVDNLTKFKRDLNQNRQTFPVNSAPGLPSAVTKELSYELRSFTYGPDNPKYSPR